MKKQKGSKKDHEGIYIISVLLLSDGDEGHLAVSLSLISFWCYLRILTFLFHVANRALKAKDD